jgi:glycopeptide antibiotics resistance protein
MVSSAGQNRSSRAWPTRRTFVIGAVAAIAFAAYGSLVPFDLRAISLDVAIREYLTFWSAPRIYLRRADVVANILLAIPIGFCLLGAQMVDRRRGAGRLAAHALATTAAGTVIAFLLEFSQIFVNDRVVSQSDVLAQTFGTWIGVAAWIAIGQSMTEWLRGRRRRGHRLPQGPRRLQSALGIYAAVWLLSMWLPLDLTLSPTVLVSKWRAGAIVLVPFGGQYDSFVEMVSDVFSTFFSAIPLGALALLTAAGLGWQWRLVSAGVAGGLFVLGAELVQLLVSGRVFDVTDILIGALGIVSGLWLTARYVALPDRLATPSARSEPIPVNAIVSAAAWSGMLAFYHWKPFAFSFDLRAARARMWNVGLLPLSQYAHESGVEILTQAVIKTGLAVPFGFFLAPWLRTRWRSAPEAWRLQWATAMVIGLAVFGVLEFGQLFLPQRVADVTDIWLGCAGMLIGFGASGHVSRGRDEESPVADGRCRTDR